MGMKRLLPLLCLLAFVVAAALAVVACRPKPAADNNTQQQLAEEQAREDRLLHEREAALDEEQRLLDERAQQMGLAPTPQPGRQTAPEQPQPLPVQPQNPPQPATPPPDNGVNVTYQQFYDSLAPYGSWILMTGYGFVWQPAAARDPNWRPYTVGRWAYTDDGWTWVSDEPFGWITYHYGRWMRTHTESWVWVPGDQWAPAWVSWRYGNDYAGWAPLPPEARFDGPTGIQQWADQQYSLGESDYVFVPASEFGDDPLAGEAVPPEDAGPIYDDSTNVTNIFENGGIIYCFGPTYEFLRSKSHGKLPPKFKLAAVAYNAAGSNGAIASNGVLQVTAPRIVKGGGGRVEKPTKVKEVGVVDARVISPGSAAPAGGGALPPVARPQMGSVAAGREQQAVRQQAQPGPVAAAQNARDVEIIQQRREEEAARTQQQQQQAAEAEAQRQRVEQQHADARQQAEQAQRTYEEAVARQKADEEATQQALHVEAARQPSGGGREVVPAGSPGIVPGGQGR